MPPLNNLPPWARTGILIIVFWGLLLLLSASQKHFSLLLEGESVAVGTLVGQQLPGILVWLILTPAMLWLSGRFPFAHGKIRFFVAVHLPAALVFTLVHDLTTTFGLYLWTGPHDNAFSPLSPRWLSHFARQPLPIEYLVLLVLHQGVVHLRQTQAAAVREADLKASLSQAQLQAIQMSLQPHFLFNVLQTVTATAVKQDSAKVVALVERLGDLLRLALSRRDRIWVTLAEELDFIEAYLSLESIRFADRLAVDWAIQPQSRRALLPHFLLQPLVENSVKYAVARRGEAGRINIGSRIENEVLVLTVADNGPDHGGGKPEGLGMGHASVRERLSLLYPDQHQWEQGSTPEGGTLIKLQIPLRYPEEGSCSEP